MACRGCRLRKVRCDVAEHGIPCCNCKLDKKECMIPERRKKRYDVNPIYNPAAPISSISSDWLSPLERPAVNHLLQFIRNQHLHSQSQINDQTQFSATSNMGYTESGQLASSPMQKLSTTTPEDPELSRWLDMMPSHIIEKFRLYFQNADEGRKGVERRTWKLETTTLTRVQQAVDILQDAVAIFKSTQPGEELLSPPPDSMFQPGTDDAVDGGSEADGNLSLGTPGFKIATSYPPSDISTIEGNDSDGWNEELMAELFYTHMGQGPISSVAD